jgi:hypothetical protein
MITEPIVTELRLPTRLGFEKVAMQTAASVAEIMGFSTDRTRAERERLAGNWKPPALSNWNVICPLIRTVVSTYSIAESIPSGRAGSRSTSSPFSQGGRCPALAMVTVPSAAKSAQQHVTNPDSRCPAIARFRSSRIAAGRRSRIPRRTPISSDTSIAAFSPFPETSPITSRRPSIT